MSKMIRSQTKKLRKRYRKDQKPGGWAKWQKAKTL
jgi:hypothetical protein